MKRVTFALCLCGLLLAACNNTTTENKTASAPDSAATIKNDADKTWVPVDSATEMKAWMAYATPGDAHKAMAKADGNWTGQVTMWASMDAPPVTSTSTMVNKMIMDGRYQYSTFKGNFMGMPFEGMAVTAYDNYKKKYLSTWIDNMGTGIMNMEGTKDDASNTITYTGKMVHPANGKECDMKEVFKIIDDNNQLMEMYGPDPKTGKQYKSMEIKLSRKK
jgi:hypothetical protein